MRQSFLLRFFRMASVVMLLVTVALLAAITTMHFAIHGAVVQVPTLMGMTVAEARSQSAGMGLSLDVDNRYYSADVAAGHILSQSPAQGTEVRRGWHVRVAESLGPQKVDVPNVVGKESRVAALELRRAGLGVGMTARLPYAGADEGTVLAQDPAAHAQGIAQPSVNLLAAAPDTSAPDGYVMPNFVGMPVVTVQEILTRQGLKTAAPTFQAAGDSAAASAGAGLVTAQEPVAGARVDATMEIKLTVAH